ncbi:MAG: LysR family transcriptional regulator [Pseudomonadota bacterium]
MELQHLRAFQNVAETGSFSLAAEKLHLTQPAVSKRIALLEQELGAELFDRIGRDVSLTEAGRVLLPHVRAVQQQLEAARQSVLDLSGEIAGELKLATSHHIGLHRLPPVLSQFSSAYEHVHIDIDFMDSEQAYDRILQNRAEIAFVTLAPAEQPSLVTLPVWPDPLAFMVGENHPLASADSVNLSILSQHAAIIPGLNTYTGQIVARLFNQHDLQLQVSMATNYLETIRMMASVGLGWTVLPRTMCDESLTELKVQQVDIARTLGLVYHRGRSLSRGARAFVDVVSAFSRHTD